MENMMKKQLRIILGLFLGLTMIGCEDLLNLDPQASISDEIALSTPSNVQTALVGAYGALGSSSTYGGSYIYLTEVFAASKDELFWNGTFIDPGEIYNKTILEGNGFVSSYWTGSYNTINRANNILAVDSGIFANAATKARIDAEAKFIRALSYYNLVQVFGKAYNDGNPSQNPAVPLVVTPTRVVDETLQVPRATVKEVYDQVVADLLEAKANLPASNGFYANTYVASGFLARVYMAMGNYQAALAEANRVIASGEYALFAEIAENYSRTSNGDETIFAMQVTATSGSNDNAVFFAPQPYGRADIRIEEGHLALYEEGDARGQLFIQTSRGVMSSKYAVPSDPTADPRRRNITVMRLAEMHLIRAEANFRLGSSVGASPVADINAIRARAGLGGGLESDVLESVTLDQILRERKLELAFEGHLFADLKRLQQTTSSPDKASISWNDNSLVFPIPAREILVNLNLTQNPGY